MLGIFSAVQNVDSFNIHNFELESWRWSSYNYELHDHFSLLVCSVLCLRHFSKLAGQLGMNYEVINLIKILFFQPHAYVFLQSHIHFLSAEVSLKTPTDPVKKILGALQRCWGSHITTTTYSSLHQFTHPDAQESCGLGYCWSWRRRSGCFPCQLFFNSVFPSHQQIRAISITCCEIFATLLSQVQIHSYVYLCPLFLKTGLGTLLLSGTAVSDHQGLNTAI